MSERDPAQIVHIPKCAGTTTEKALIDMCGPGKVFYYLHEKDLVVRADAKFGILNMRGSSPVIQFLKSSLAGKRYYPLLINCYRRLRNLPSAQKPEELSKLDFMAITGHFDANRFDNILPNTSPKCIALREPLARFISFFLHEMRNKNATSSPDLAEILREYAENSDYWNEQTRYLGDVALNDFVVVGVTERIEAYIFSVCRAIDPEGRLPKVGVYNKNPLPFNLDALRIDGTFRSKFTTNNGGDYSNYARAQKLVTRQIRA